MLNTFFGKKTHQTHIFTEDGKRIPVTAVLATPCTVVQIKSEKADGYWALQLGFDNRTSKHVAKPLAGHLKKTGQGNYLPRFLREVRFAPDAEVTYKVGEQITVDKVLKVGDIVKVTGVSKGKGFQGGVKRHHFAGGSRTHGQSDRERAPGSIGQTTTPGRVYRGKRMAGHMGHENITVKGLTVVGIDTEKQTILIKGLVPGTVYSPLIITKKT